MRIISAMTCLLTMTLIGVVVPSRPPEVECLSVVVFEVGYAFR